MNEVGVPTRDEVLTAMETRATARIPEGQPIIPDGVLARKEDTATFQSAVHELGYTVKFGKDKAVTISDPRDRRVQLTQRCRIGELTDEFLHVWNNWNEQRGVYLEGGEAEEHKFLSRQKHFSGSSNDRRFHQLELKNFVHHLRSSGAHIPIFVWKTFTDLAL